MMNIECIRTWRKRRRGSGAGNKSLVGVVLWCGALLHQPRTSWGLQVSSTPRCIPINCTATAQTTLGGPQWKVSRPCYCRLHILCPWVVVGLITFTCCTAFTSAFSYTTSAMILSGAAIECAVGRYCRICRSGSSRTIFALYSLLLRTSNHLWTSIYLKPCT